MPVSGKYLGVFCYQRMMKCFWFKDCSTRLIKLNITFVGLVYGQTDLWVACLVTCQSTVSRWLTDCQPTVSWESCVQNDSPDSLCTINVQKKIVICILIVRIKMTKSVKGHY